MRPASIDREPNGSRAEAFEARWVETLFEVPFRVGEITVFRRRFRALTLANHYFDLPTDPSIPRPPLERLGRDAEVIITLSHPVAVRPARVSIVNGALRYVPKCYTRYHATLTGTFEGYLSKYSAKTRSTLRRKVKRFQERAYGAGFRMYTTPEEMIGFLDAARNVSALTYQERLLDAGLPDDPEFKANLIELARRNSIRAFLLSAGDKPVAYLCCPAVDGVLLYSYLGYDPEQAEASPGTVLQYLAFEALFGEQAFRAFDFAEGEGEHKKFFGTQGTLCADVYYFPGSLASRFWVTLHSTLDGLSAAAGELLQRVGLKAVVKRFLRGL